MLEGAGMSEKVDPWIDGHIKPVRKGVYQRNYGAIDACRTRHLPDGMGNNGLGPTMRLTKHFQ